MPSANKSPTIVRRSSTTPSATQQSLALELPEAKTAVAVECLWLCIHLPALPLEAISQATDDKAWAIFEEQEGIRKVLMANSLAMAAGIVPGFSVNAALALLPTLELEPRDLGCERQALLNLAAWAEQFTSFVSIEAATTLLLELAGSVRLFGGLLALRQRISIELTQQGFTASLAIAPTPLAATWLARIGRRACVRSAANLVGVLSGLPLRCLACPISIYESLQGMGITSIGDCLRLPRQGFVKRFGAHFLLQFDRALGRLPDPRVGFRSPEVFSRDYELNEELSDSQLILNVCMCLLQDLEQFLLQRQLAVQRIVFSFFYLQHPAMHLPLGCMQADRRAERWFELLSIHFEKVQLAAPVISIRLRTGGGQPLVATSGRLPFSKQTKQQHAISIEHLLERLSARIGSESVHGVTTVAEHRPDHAWQSQYLLHNANECLQNTATYETSLPARPLWMLRQPEPLAVREEKPLYQGVLTLTEGPERLETGWWDKAGIARDYFVAVNPKGIRLWIYKNRNRQKGWYLHGIFG